MQLGEKLLNSIGYRIGSLAEMKSSDVPTDSVASLKKTINEKQTQFAKDLDKLYQHQAQRYLDDAHDRYLSFEEAEVVEKTEQGLKTLPHADVRTFVLLLFFAS